MPPDERLPINQVVPPDVTHVGFVLRDRHGRYSIIEPEQPKHGVTANLPRVELRPHESPATGLGRCLEDIIGWGTRSWFPLYHVWETPNSRTYYFAGYTPADQPQGTVALRWYTPHDAMQALSRVAYEPTRERNLQVLERVGRLCLSPLRRVLEMVAALHRMGYERLRAPAYMYPLAWRCPVVPALMTSQEHGGMLADNVTLPPYLQTHEGHTGYSSASDQFELFADFPARNLAFAQPCDFAEEFVRLRPHTASMGWGPDPAYASWLQRTLADLGPHGIYYAFAEYQEATTYLYAEMSPLDRVPLPPPGPYSAQVWQDFRARHAKS